MLPSIFVMRLRKPADDFFKNIPHLQIGDYAWMEICLGRCKFLNYDIENALICHRSDMTVKFELLDNILYIFRKTVQVITKISFDIIGII